MSQIHVTTTQHALTIEYDSNVCVRMQGSQKLQLSVSYATRVSIYATGIYVNVHTVCLSVRPSITFQYCAQTNDHTIVWFSASGRTILLVSEEVTLSRYAQRIIPSEGIKLRHPHVDSDNLTNNRP